MEEKDIHKEMLPMYGEHCLSRKAVHNWLQKYSEGRTSIEDEHRAGRPVEIATPETLQRVEDIIRAARRDPPPPPPPPPQICIQGVDGDTCTSLSGLIIGH